MDHSVLPLLAALPICLAVGALGPLKAFKPGEIKFRPGRLKDAFDLNARYLKSLDSDMLLYSYRFAAFRKTPGTPSGGWEHPLNHNRGSFLGHWLSAAAYAIAQTGDKDLKAKADAIVADLAKSQVAFGGGWVQARGPQCVFILEGEPCGDSDFEVIAAPYYPVHKLLAGLLLMNQLTGNAQALEVARHLADWIKGRVDKLTDTHLQQMLEREHGGMVEVLLDLSEACHSKAYADLAKRFEHHAFTDPLSQGKDNLTNLHANTQLPKLAGSAREYELLGDLQARKTFENAWRFIEQTRTFCTGGSNSEEYWREPNKLAATLGTRTQESCTTYNWLKLTGHMLRWTGDARYADVLERSLWNGILPAQNPATGMYLYFLPLTTSGAKKEWGTPTDSFWCCYGTMVEQFASLLSDAYAHTDRMLVVNLYGPSEVQWNGMTIQQETAYPEEDQVSIVVRTSSPRSFDLALRIPAWCSEPTAKVNGKAVEARLAPGTYVKLAREWRDGDRIDLQLPMKLAWSPINDDPTLRAVMYGPLVLGALASSPVTLPVTLDKSPRHPNMEFTLSGVSEKVRMLPLYRIVDDAYVAYVRVSGR